MAKVAAVLAPPAYDQQKSMLVFEFRVYRIRCRLIAVHVWRLEHASGEDPQQARLKKKQEVAFRAVSRRIKSMLAADQKALKQKYDGPYSSFGYSSHTIIGYDVFFYMWYRCGARSARARPCYR